MPNLKYFKNKEERNEWYREYRAKNREKFRDYNRKYNSDWRKKNGYEAEKRSLLKYPEKEKSRRILRAAVKSGNIKREACEVCSDPKSQGHHEDYTKPLQVKWLCPLHHRQADDQLRLKKQGLKKFSPFSFLKNLLF